MDNFSNVVIQIYLYVPTQLAHPRYFLRSKVLSITRCNTKIITYIYTSCYHLLGNFFKQRYLNIFKMSIQTFLPRFIFADEQVRRLTQVKIIILRQRI